MTSQRMNQKQLNQFKQYYRSFIFGQSNGYELVQAINSIPNIEKKIVQQGLIQNRKHLNLTAKQQMQINAHRWTQLFKLSKESKNPALVWRNPDWVYEIYGFGLNTGAFLPTIQYIGTREQVQYWKNLVMSGKVIGGYGQTQLGHGSNVQMLQTQALYNQQTGSFIINTPKNTATKFWPGCFGIFSTHCVLQAKTIVKGKNIGIQTFVVPLRDQYLNLYSGVQAGDIGPKIGFVKVDNGFVKFNNFQIPRQNMLSRYVQVQADGTVHGLQNKQAIKYAYGSMLNLRVKLVIGFALQYIYFPAVIQNEINSKSNKANCPIMKKRSTQVFCTAIGILLSNMYVTKIFKQFVQNLSKQNFERADKLLISCHIMSSTFKALSSWRSEQIARQFITMNQFGTYQSSYLPKVYTDIIPSVTYEGDNSVLLQQTAKFILMKEKDTDLVKPKQQINSNNLNEVLAMYRYIVSSQIRHLKSLIQKEVESGKDFKEVWNEIYQSKILQVSRLWGTMTLIFTCTQTLKTVKSYNHFFQTIAKVFVSTLIQQTKEITFYGFKVSQSTAWKQLSEDEFEVLSDLNRPLKKQFQPQSYYTRGNKDVQDWIYSRL